MSEVIVRFAPSPTGYLHVGGARTALFNYLFARNQNAKFLLRIEDTDKQRSTQESVNAIINGLTWLGLEWDNEKIIFQSERFEVYNSIAKELIKKDFAYYCYCSPEEIAIKKENALKNKLNYKHCEKCRDLKQTPNINTSYVIRFKTPEDGKTIFQDLIHGEMSFDNNLLDDFIIIRSDGLPTYNLSVVIDDNEMNISHVIRGDDHLSNTPKQILIYEALDLKLPHFAHIPMILGNDKTRLSKRHGATSVMSYAEDGFLSEAMINYLVRLGWSKGDQEIFTKEEMIKYFSLDAVNKTSAVFDTEKAKWLNSQYFKILPSNKILKELKVFWEKLNIDFSIYSEDKLEYIVMQFIERAKTFLEMAETSKFLFERVREFEDNLKTKFLNKDNLAIFELVYENLNSLDTWELGQIESIFKDVSAKLNKSLTKIIQPIRVAICGRTATPGMYEIIYTLGKKETLERLNFIIENLK